MSESTTAYRYDPRQRSTKKKDQAPRGVFRHRSGVWAVRYACGAGCAKHEEKVGPLKSDAIRVYHSRRARAVSEPGWCPRVERREAREHAQVERQRELARTTFAEHVPDFIAWAKVHHRSWAKDDSRLSRVLPVLGAKKLDEITTADVERFLAVLGEGERAVAPATVNRYRDLLSGIFRRAIRLGLLTSNPVKGIPKLKEPGGRIVYLPPGTTDRRAYEEDALRDALPPELRPLFGVSVHTGLRWSEQAGLEWRDVDMLTGVIDVARSKNGYGRRLPMNSASRALLFDLATRRTRTDDPRGPVFAHAYRTVARAFERAVERAKATLRDAGQDATHLDGYTWHANRHTFASRLVMAGVDPLTVRELGGWRTLAMVQRYAHLAPDHLRAAIERLVPIGPAGAPRADAATELRRNFDDPRSLREPVEEGVR